MINGVQFLKKINELKGSVKEVSDFLQQETSAQNRLEWDLQALRDERNGLQSELESVKATIATAKKEAEAIKQEAMKKASEIESSAKKKTIDFTIELNKIREEIASLEHTRYKLKE